MDTGILLAMYRNKTTSQTQINIYKTSLDDVCSLPFVYQATASHTNQWTTQMALE